jgi:cobyrinic acid a,c-diamide synthase
MAIAIGAERSSAGKTTVTLAMLAYLVKRGLRVQSYKVGPDYIDPMFHHYVSGRVCRNLDPVLTSEAYVQTCFTTSLQNADCALVEGVMGLFDGSGEKGDFGSTAHVAHLLGIPVVLVVDCSRMSHSVAALVHGYRSFDPQIQLAGVVLNRVGSDRHLQLLTSALDNIQVPILGVLRRQDRITIPDRHLGLIPTTELPHLNTLVDQLAYLGEICFDWQQLMPLLEHGNQQQSTPPPPHPSPTPHPPIRLAIAQDSAFSFYYADNLELFTNLGAELIHWSPLQDTELPEGTQGLYFGGGFPEMFAQQLSDNHAARDAVRAAIQAGMPTYAECGGLMYLCQQMVDFKERPYPMVGILPTIAVMGKRLNLGYRRAIAQQDTPLLAQGQMVWGHEFHRSSLTTEPERPVFEINTKPGTLEKPNSKLQTPNSIFPPLSSSPSPPPPPSPLPPSTEGWHLYQLHASYIHLHWGACSEIPIRFLKHCQQFKPMLRN